jgi:antitoxin YobK
MTKEWVKQFIEENAEYAYFYGGCDEETIREIETELGVLLPESYKWFLREYGYGSMYSCEVEGVAKRNGAKTVVETTLKWRWRGMPSHYVAIKNVDEFAYCLDPLAGYSEDCPVINWGWDNGVSYPKASGFYAYLEDEFLNAQENWD